MQSPVEHHLRQIILDLNEIGTTNFALIGGLAIGARVEPRFTRDIDFGFAVNNDEEAEQITSRLIHKGYIPCFEFTHRVTGRLATFRMRYKRKLAGIEPDESPFIDLLFSHSGIERETVQAATRTEPLPGLHVPTACIPHLIAMKTLSESDRRLQDRIDLQNLIAVATNDDLQQVPPLLDLITQRGFAESKDLQAVFRLFLNQAER